MPNVEIPEDVFDELKKKKGNMTWGNYLNKLAGQVGKELKKPKKREDFISDEIIKAHLGRQATERELEDKEEHRGAESKSIDWSDKNAVAKRMKDWNKKRELELQRMERDGELGGAHQPPEEKKKCQERYDRIHPNNPFMRKDPEVLKLLKKPWDKD